MNGDDEADDNVAGQDSAERLRDSTRPERSDQYSAVRAVRAVQADQRVEAAEDQILDGREAARAPGIRPTHSVRIQAPAITAAASPTPTESVRRLSEAMARAQRAAVDPVGIGDLHAVIAASPALEQVSKAAQLTVTRWAESLAPLVANQVAFSFGESLKGADSFGSVARSVAHIQAEIALSLPVRQLSEGVLGSDMWRVRALATQQLAITSGIAGVIDSDKLLGPWRQSLLAEATARSLLATIEVSDGWTSLLRDIVGANTVMARVVARFAGQNTVLLTPALGARPTRLLRSYLTGMDASPSVADLVFASRASRGVAGLTAADLLVGQGDVEREAGDLLEGEIVEPWLTGPETSRRLLFAGLAHLDPDVPDLLRGAWSQVESDGPAAPSLACHALQEVVDRTLRALAPDDAVLCLHAAGVLPPDAVYEKEKGLWRPTRVGRIFTALHQRRPAQAKLIRAQAKAMAASVTVVVEGLQSGKHASTATVSLVRTWLVSVESVLTQLLYQPDPD